jgi:hypothetical protein
MPRICLRDRWEGWPIGLSVNKFRVKDGVWSDSLCWSLGYPPKDDEDVVFSDKRYYNKWMLPYC